MRVQLHSEVVDEIESERRRLRITKFDLKAVPERIISVIQKQTRRTKYIEYKINNALENDTY